MKRKEPLPGFAETDWELQGAILKTTIETRVLLCHLREIRRAIRNANRMGHFWNFERHLINYLNKDMALNLQRITRQVNAARRYTLDFLKKNKGASFSLCEDE